MNYNKIIQVGRLTRDTEQTAVGETSVVKFGLANNRRYKNRNDETIDEPLFLDCEIWGPRGESLHRYCKKGDPILIEGRLKLNQWTTQDGQARSKLIVVVESWQFMQTKQDSGSSNGSEKPKSDSYAPSPTLLPDEIPF